MIAIVQGLYTCTVVAPPNPLPLGESELLSSLRVTTYIIPYGMNAPDRKFCVAPMMRRTDRHFRYMLRLLSQRAMLYTEMVTARALLHGDAWRLLAFHPRERPLALQIAGHDAARMARCAVLAQQAGYDEINVNVGCPSARAQSGNFGACLMQRPEIVAHCVAEMAAAARLPVTVKCRTGIARRDARARGRTGNGAGDDAEDDYGDLCRFVESVSQAGCKTFIIHARKALLGGASPKQNRRVPPLRYDRAYDLKRDFPKLEIILNGGLQSLEQAQKCIENLDGVMLGRAVYADPFMLRDVDHLFYEVRDAPGANRRQIAQAMMGYIETALEQGVPTLFLMRHLVHWGNGRRGIRGWRRWLCLEAPKLPQRKLMPELRLRLEAICPEAA